MASTLRRRRTGGVVGGDSGCGADARPARLSSAASSRHLGLAALVAFRERLYLRIRWATRGSQNRGGYVESAINIIGKAVLVIAILFEALW